MNRKEIQRMAVLAMLTAITIGFQFLGGFIKFGTFSITAVMVPLVIGAVMYGPWAGAYLGGVFGVAVFLTGDPAPFLAVNIPGTIITVMLKGILAGFAAGLIYKALEKCNRYAAGIAAAIVCPVVNTGIFLLCGCIFFLDTLKGWGAVEGYNGVVAYMFLGLVGFNFLFELLLNVVLSPVIVRIIDIGKKKFS